MGKQVRFYMTYEDERAFLETVQRERGPIVVTLGTSKGKLEVIEELMPVTVSSAHMAIMRTADLEDVVSYIPTQRCYSIAMLNSPIIEFTRCEMRHDRYRTEPGWLGTGRLWFAEWTLDGERKNEEFCAWANKLFAWFRRHYKRTEYRSEFVGPEAADLIARSLLKLSP